jgi:hypothetical protein
MVAVGKLLTVTVAGEDTTAVPFVVTVTVKVPELLTEIDWVVAPVDH